MHYQNAIQSMPSILRWKQVEKIIPWSKSYTYVLINQGLFPKPQRLMAGGQAVGWLASDIDTYMRSLAKTMGSSKND